jgi:hypothetical protein
MLDDVVLLGACVAELCQLAEKLPEPVEPLGHPALLRRIADEDNNAMARRRSGTNYAK